MLCVLLQVVSAPFPEDLNKDPFFLLKGDIFSGESKSVREPSSVMVGYGLSNSGCSSRQLWTLSSC
jgi:hypothetical protein